MDTLATTGQVADRLGTTRSRVHRAVAQGHARPATTAGGHLRFAEADIERLERRLGRAPKIEGLNREQVLVAAALLGRPLGLRSARAVARVAGVSPTTASHALRRLLDLGLVRRRRRLAMLGVATEVEVWEVDLTNSRWAELAPALAETVLPRQHRPPATDGRVPGWLRHLFWNADVRRLEPSWDAAYVAGRIIASEDAQAHAWAAVNLPGAAFLAAARMRGVPPRRAALARNLAAER